MKIITTISIVVLSGTFALGQTVAVSGTVNNQKGQPVPYAFVRDAQHNYATFADSTGSFVLKADPASALQVSAVNYKETHVRIENKTNVNVVLPADAVTDGVSSLNSIKQNANSGFLQARQQLVAEGVGVQTVREGFQQEATRGSRYLYSDWVPAFGIGKNETIIFENTNFYNYDKLNGSIIYTNDGKSMAQVSPDQIKSFSLFDRKGHAHVYENAPAINGKPFVEVLVSTPKYKIYKKIDTKLQRADFHTDGVLEMGHRYDEYVDVERYYFVGADGKPQAISLKKSALKKLLGGEADAFIASQGSRDVDEDYVRDLGNSLIK
ncbi:carboxypeptidase-like regulatory domain-containing protein [Mucilaginibacter xinganensis]|uniref:Carboxypeptidase-like regulatory domain-containing protein n=1 Tax=Mucilaginibacter xinganensis TaxID=1234841 RepID=A0A223NRL0_9SPHI|nr:carboxypeptidase-like regulatory domain-containing protein [Mucilaginibacter xinganensis]ASU32545.1 hypothetical protein MuYL_0642 [Mucilaginibacter xinganensis]